MPHPPQPWDVVVMGGSLSGAAISGLLRRAAETGASVVRGAKVRTPVLLEPGGRQMVTYETARGTRTATARWVVDATGFACTLAR